MGGLHMKRIPKSSARCRTEYS